MHNMACSANLSVLTGTGRSLGTCSDPERHSGIQLTAKPRMGIGTQYTTKSTSRVFPSKNSGPPKSLSYLLHQSSFSFNFLQQLLSLGDLLRQRRGCCHGVLQLPLGHGSRTASVGAAAAPSHLQSHPSTLPSASQLYPQGSFAALVIPCRRQRHTLVMQLLLCYVLCVRLQHSPWHRS